MHFVEQHANHTGQFGIADQHAGENAFGHHLNAGGCRRARIQPGAIANGLTNRLPQLLGHALGRGAGGKTTGRKQDELASAGPLFTEQRGRHRGSLACTRRRHQRHRVIAGQCRLQLRQHGEHR